MFLRKRSRLLQSNENTKIQNVLHTAVQRATVHFERISRAVAELDKTLRNDVFEVIFRINCLTRVKLGRSYTIETTRALLKCASIIVHLLGIDLTAVFYKEKYEIARLFGW